MPGKLAAVRRDRSRGSRTTETVGRSVSGHLASIAIAESKYVVFESKKKQREV
jgi:hypothetical protein